MNYFLLPNKFKKPGMILLTVFVVLGLFFTIFDWQPEFLNVRWFSLFPDDLLGSKNNLMDEILSVGIILSGLMAGFSREKEEDEYISRIRLNALVWAVYVNYAILLLAIIFISGTAFLSVMIYNMFTTILFFIIRYQWLLYRGRKEAGDEE